MVKVHAEGAFRVYIYSPPREHEPPHVHVESSNGGEVLIRLGRDDMLPTLWQNHHMTLADAHEAIRIVRTHRHHFLDVWRSLHG